MTWNPKTYEEGLRMAWDEDDDGIDHCLSYIEPHLPFDAGAWIVDLGCGVGRLTVPLAKRHPQTNFLGLDTSIAMIRQAKRHADGQSNVVFDTRWSVDFMHGGFSVVAFQHMTDDAMRTYLERVAPRPFVFQFVEGTEREPLSMQRDLGDVSDWCFDAGFTDVEGERDSRFPNWWWFVCK